MPLLMTTTISVSDEIWEATDDDAMQAIVDALETELQSVVDSVNMDHDTNLELSFG